MTHYNDLTDDQLNYWVALATDREPTETYRPANDWQQCGELIEERRVELRKGEDGWAAHTRYAASFARENPKAAVCMAIIMNAYEEDDL